MTIKVKDRYNAANETNTRLVSINAALVERVADRDMQLAAAVEGCNTIPLITPRSSTRDFPRNFEATTERLVGYAVIEYTDGPHSIAAPRHFNTPRRA